MGLVDHSHTEGVHVIECLRHLREAKAKALEQEGFEEPLESHRYLRANYTKTLYEYT